MGDKKSYATPVKLGDVMTGEAVARVLTSHHPGYAEGDIVVAVTGWRTHALSDGILDATRRSQARHRHVVHRRRPGHRARTRNPLLTATQAGSGDEGYVATDPPPQDDRVLREWIELAVASVWTLPAKPPKSRTRWSRTR